MNEWRRPGIMCWSAGGRLIHIRPIGRKQTPSSCEPRGLGWAGHVTIGTEASSFVLSTELAAEVAEFARWHGIPQERLIHDALTGWMEDH